MMEGSLVKLRDLFQYTFKLVAFATLIAEYSQAQTLTLREDNFEEQVLSYSPAKRSSVSQSDFERGLLFLSETKSAVQNDPNKFVAADYWNVSIAFLVLGEPKEHIRIAFEKAAAADPAAICRYIEVLSPNLDSKIPITFFEFYKQCPSLTAASSSFDVEAYIARSDFEGSLVRQVYDIRLDDQRYRPGLGEAQRQLDSANQDKIDQLYFEYGRYIGNSLVGQELEYVMFLVIQHSNIEYMEKYLPLVADAVKEGELSSALPLKLLLDRVTLIREGCQVFGSQGSAMLCPELKRRTVRVSYGFE